MIVQEEAGFVYKGEVWRFFPSFARRIDNYDQGLRLVQAALKEMADPDRRDPEAKGEPWGIQVADMDLGVVFNVWSPGRRRAAQESETRP